MEKIAAPWGEKEVQFDKKGKAKGENEEEGKEEEKEGFDVQFKEEELERALRKETAAPGLDSIEYRMIKKLSEGYKKEIEITKLVLHRR